ncbi:MAG: Arm DNA-binding domain-containing protein, partial [Capnocytophaga sp.]|nr:Arm DNA-binding domain-containing protein [Capnocytophaga sp.]
MNVKVVPRNYVDKQGMSTLYLVITSQGKRVRQNLNIKVNPAEWDNHRQRLRKSAVSAVETNLLIDNAVKKITDIRTEYYLSDRDLT